MNASPVVVLTRAAADNVALAGVARQAGADVAELVCLTTRPLPADAATQAALAQLDAVDAVVLASRAGVAAFAATLAAAGTPLPPRCAVYAVGPATAAAARIQFARPVHTAAVHHAEGLAATVLAQLQASPRSRGAPVRLLLPGAQGGRPQLAEALRQAGHAVDRLAVYATVPAPARTPRVTWDGRLHYIVCASPSGVAGFVAQADWPRRCRPLSIGPTTSAALRARGKPPYAEAASHDVAGLTSLVQQVLLRP